MTWNNPSEDAEKYLRDLDGVNLLVFGRETGESGTRHLQIYLTWSKIASFPAMKKLFPLCHIEPAKAKEMAANYCMKDGDYEKIDNRRPGHRSDFDAIRLLAVERRFADIRDSHPADFARYHAGIYAMARAVNETLLRDPPRVFWFFGSTGTGKSFVAQRLCDIHSTWWSGEQFPKYFSGYQEHKAVVLDDMRSTKLSLPLALRLFDRYPMTVPSFGAFSNFVPAIIVVTSPFAIGDFFGRDEDLSQLRRRIFAEVNFDTIPEGNSDIDLIRLELQCLLHAKDDVV